MYYPSMLPGLADYAGNYCPQVLILASGFTFVVWNVNHLVFPCANLKHANFNMC